MFLLYYLFPGEHFSVAVNIKAIINSFKSLYYYFFIYYVVQNSFSFPAACQG